MGVCWGLPWGIPTSGSQSICLHPDLLGIPWEVLRLLGPSSLGQGRGLQQPLYLTPSDAETRGPGDKMQETQLAGGMAKLTSGVQDNHRHFAWICLLEFS